MAPANDRFPARTSAACNRLIINPLAGAGRDLSRRLIVERGFYDKQRRWPRGTHAKLRRDDFLPCRRGRAGKLNRSGPNERTRTGSRGEKLDGESVFNNTCPKCLRAEDQRKRIKNYFRPAQSFLLLQCHYTFDERSVEEFVSTVRSLSILETMYKRSRCIGHDTETCKKNYETSS